MQTLYGLVNILSLVFLTFVVAVVMGPHENGRDEAMRHPVLGCWFKLLGSILGLMLVLLIMHLATRP